MANNSAAGRPRLSISVMGHPVRSALISELQRAVGTEAVPSYTATRNCDPSVIESAAAAWSSASESATHHLVLQDDVMVCDQFVERAMEVASHMPDTAIAFFTDWGSKSSYAARLGALAGFRWIPVMDDFVPTQALLLPRHIATELGSWFNDHLEPLMEQGHSALPEDVLVHRFLKQRKVRELVYLPNLVEHRDVPSIAGNEWMGIRRSVCYASDNLFGERIPKVALEEIGALPYYQWEAGRAWLMRRSGQHKGRKVLQPLQNALALRGWPPEITIAIVREHVCDHDVHSRLLLKLNDVVNLAAALVMCAAGVLGHTKVCRDAISEKAFQSLGVGALRQLFPEVAIPKHRVLLEQLVDGSAESARRQLESGVVTPIVG